MGQRQTHTARQNCPWGGLARHGFLHMLGTLEYSPLFFTRVVVFISWRAGAGRRQHRMGRDVFRLPKAAVRKATNEKVRTTKIHKARKPQEPTIEEGLEEFFQDDDKALWDNPDCNRPTHRNEEK